MWTVWIVDFIDMNTYSYKTQEFQNILKRKLCSHFGQYYLFIRKVLNMELNMIF